jgi:hypothetical protein
MENQLWESGKKIFIGELERKEITVLNIFAEPPATSENRYLSYAEC